MTAQVDSGARFYKPTKQSKDPESKATDSELVSSAQKQDKIKHPVPQIGALGAFTALSGGLIGGVSLSEGDRSARVSIEKETTSEEIQKRRRKSSFRIDAADDIEPEVDAGRKFSTAHSIMSADDEDCEDAPTGIIFSLFR